MTVKPYLRPPAVLTRPVSHHFGCTRRFQDIPGIEASPGGRLWATWYGGGLTEDRFNYVMAATSADAGHSWSRIRIVIDPDGDGPVRAFDPCLWHDPRGRLWLFWAQGYERQTDARGGVWAMTTDQSDDETPLWSQPARICDGILMNKPTVLFSGEWLLPVARWKRDGSSQVYASHDKGETWMLRGQANIPDEKDRDCDEHMIVERRDGALWMWVRTRYGIGESVSHDAGRTWSPVAPAGIPHPASRFFVRRLHSGAILLVKHGDMETPTGRSHLTAFLSGDDGRSWSGGLLIDKRAGVSYPDGAQARDGTIYLVYDYDRQGEKEILMARFSENDVARGKACSDMALLGVIIHKARGPDSSQAV